MSKKEHTGRNYMYPYYSPHADTLRRLQGYVAGYIQSDNTITCICEPVDKLKELISAEDYKLLKELNNEI